MKYKITTLLLFITTTLCFSQDKEAKFLNLLNTATEKEQIYKYTDSLMTFYWDNGPDDKHAIYAEKFLKLAEELEDYDNFIEISIQLSGNYISKGVNTSKAERLITNAENYLKFTKDQYLIATTYNRRAGLLFVNGDTENALQYCNKSINNYEEQDSLYKADAIYFRGRIYQSIRDNINALKDFDLAHQYFKNLGEKDDELSAMNSEIVVFASVGLTDKAIEERLKLINKIEEAGGDHMQNYFNLAMSYKKIGDFANYKKYILLALDTSESYKNYENHLSILYAELIEMYVRFKDEKNAVKSIMMLNSLNRDELGDYFKLNSLIAEAGYFLFKNNKQKALSKINYALKVASAFEDVDVILAVNERAHEIYKAYGDNEKALKHYELYAKLKDSTNSVKKVNGLSYYQTLYETEQREKEIITQKSAISLLEKDNQSKKRQLIFSIIGLILLASIIYLVRNRVYLSKRKKLQEDFSQKLLLNQEEERKRISKDLHDGLGQSLLLVKNKLRGTNPEEAQSMINDVVEEMRLISRELHPFQLKEVGFSKAINNLVNQLDENTDIMIFGDIDDIDEQVSDEIQINLFRIIQESLNNVIKHANAASAKVTLTLEKGIRLIIQDNGKGFALTKQKDLYENIGLKTIEERVRLLNGKFQIHSKKDVGTKISIDIPKL